MNTLVHMQKKLYDPNLSEEEYAQRWEEFISRYNFLRGRNEASLLGRLSRRSRTWLHPLLTFIHVVKNRALGLSHTVLHDGRQPTEQPVIFAVTHIGKFDIEVLCEVLKEHCYILSGDYENVQGTIVELFFSLNGAFYFNERVRADRAHVKEKMIAHLADGGNILFFPEGAWNLSPNQPILPCYWGIIDVARYSRAVIVPVAVEQYGKHFDINFGANFDVRAYTDTAEGKTLAITALRDALATLKWEIWENHPAKRRDIADDAWRAYLDARLREWTYFSLDYVDTLVYHPKGLVPPEEVFGLSKRWIAPPENQA